MPFDTETQLYLPEEGDTRIVLLLRAYRDYLLSDPALLALLPSGADGFVLRGNVTPNTPTPIIVPTIIGSRTDNRVSEWYRVLVYVFVSPRGVYEVETLLERIQQRTNDHTALMAFLTFPPEAQLTVYHVQGGSTSAYATYPQWGMEGRGLYVEFNVSSKITP